MELMADYLEGVTNGFPGGIADDSPVAICPNCRTPKQYDFAFNGKINRVSVLCACEEAERDERKRRDDERQRMAKIKRLRSNGLTDAAYLEWTFDRDNGTNPALTERFRRYVEKWDEIKRDNLGILLCGPVGTGKTFFACCIANALIDKSVPALVTNIPKLINKLQSGFDEDRNAFIKSLDYYGLLVIDDLGAEANTEFRLEQLFHVIDSRYRSGRPMIVTTNLSPADMKNPENMAYERVFDRIKECCTPMTIAGESQRTQKAAEKRQKLAALLN